MARFILSYQGSGESGECITPALPFVSESIEQARTEFAAACLAAFLSDQRYFNAFGREFMTYNFFRPTNEQQIRQVRHRHPGVKLEVHLDGHGRMHRQTRPKIETVDAWFDRTLAVATAEALG